MESLRITYFLVIASLLVSFALSEPIPAETSSFAVNSDGKGQVMVSCNGKTYTAEGAAACTSSASYSVPVAGYTILGILTVARNFHFCLF